MDSLKIICAADADNTIVSLGEVPKFEKGQLVKVIDGVFKGVVGRVARWQGQQRVGVVVDELVTVCNSLCAKCIFGNTHKWTIIMELTFHNNYKEESDKEIVEKIITVPYNEEAAAYLLYNRYDPLLFKLYRKIFDKNLSWYDDCLGDLFDYLKGKNQDWNKLRTFEWRCNFGPWLGRTANNRFLEIKPYLIGKIQNSISIDDDEDRTPVQLPDNGVEDYEQLQKKIMLLEAIGMLKDPDQKFVILNVSKVTIARKLLNC